MLCRESLCGCCWRRMQGLENSCWINIWVIILERFQELQWSIVLILSPKVIGTHVYLVLVLNPTFANITVEIWHVMELFFNPALLLIESESGSQWLRNRELSVVKEKRTDKRQFTPLTVNWTTRIFCILVFTSIIFMALSSWSCKKWQHKIY